ncbi:DUF4007 family protein [Azospirillum brasilense]|nr:DUF4007 family protein [Azospirillum brasilense]
MKHALTDPEIRGQFAGHETFPLRLLWLKKAYDAIAGGAPSGTFHEQSAIARFGVGRNMAVAMRYWALATGFAEERERTIQPTLLGSVVLANDGYDPFIERAATVWLAHWGVAATPEWTSTAYFAFNGLASIEFDASTLVEELARLVRERGWRATPNTLKRDVEVFLRSYVRREGVATDDAAEPLLAELGLIREARLGGWFEFVRGPKPSLPDGIFAYALNQFWERSGGPVAITAEQACYAPGSPGRVFKLDENSVITRLMLMEKMTDGAWRWTDTAGLRQLQRVEAIDEAAMIAAGYGRRDALRRDA